MRDARRVPRSIAGEARTSRRRSSTGDAAPAAAPAPDPIAVGALQACVGALVYLPGALLVVHTFGLSAIACGAASAYASTWIGNAYGGRRASFAWPWLWTVVGGCAGVTATLLLGSVVVACVVLPPLVTGDPQPSTPLLMGLAFGLLGSAVVAGAVRHPARCARVRLSTPPSSTTRSSSIRTPPNGVSASTTRQSISDACFDARSSAISSSMK